jgi:hypothetical protein
MFEYLVIIAAVASLIAAFVYIRSMFVGGTKPNRVSWLMWAIAPLIGTAAALSNGVGWAVLPVFMAGFSPFLIFTIFLCKEGLLETINLRLCMWSAVGFALIMWWLTNNPISPSFLLLQAMHWHQYQLDEGLDKSKQIRLAFIIGTLELLQVWQLQHFGLFTEYAFPSYLIIVNIMVLSALQQTIDFLF